MSIQSNDFDRQRRASVTKLYVRGHSLREIAHQLSLSDAAVEHQLSEIRKEWIATALCGGTEAKARELAKLDHLESEAWRAWERSQKKFTRIKKSEKPETITETRSGEPKYIAAAQRAIEMRMAIFGIIGPKKSKTLATDSKKRAPHIVLLEDVAEDMARNPTQDGAEQDAVNENTPNA